MATLLQSISLHMATGEIVGLVGPSGAGKTSLLRLLNRLQDPTSGTIYINDRDLRQMPAVQLRQQVVLMGQESKLLGMTVEDAMRYPLRLRNLPPEEIQHQVKGWQEALQIPPEWSQRTDVELSAGQRQQVAWARALVINAPVLLMDEPTASLDVGRATRYLKLLQEAAAQNHQLVVMANHQLDLIQQVCSRVLYLQAGRLVDDQLAENVDWDVLRDRITTAELTDQQEWDGD